jgi:hypothetical protein
VVEPLKADVGFSLVDVGRIAARAVRDRRGRGLRSRRNAVGGEATRKVCGVLVAMLQGCIMKLCDDVAVVADMRLAGSRVVTARVDGMTCSPYLIMDALDDQAMAMPVRWF